MRTCTQLLFMLLLLCGQGVQAKISPSFALRLTPSQDSWLQQKQTLVIGMTASDWAPYSFYLGNDHYEGLLHDYLGTIGQRLGLSVRYRSYPNLSDAQKALKRGEVDTLAGVAATSQRLEWLRLTTPFIEVPRAVLLGKVGAALDLAQAAELRWVCERGYDSCDILESLGFKQIKKVDLSTEAMFMVKFGLSDAYLSDLPFLQTNLSTLKLKQDHLATDLPWLEPARLSLGTLVANENLGDVLTLAVDSLTLQDRYNLTRLAQNYSKPTHKEKTSNLFTPEEITWIANHQEVRFAPGPWIGLGQIDQNGHFTGLVADLLTLIERRSGLRFILQPTHNQNSLIMTEEGKLDLSPTVVNLPERRQRLLFTPDYLTLKRLLLTRSEKDELHSLNELKGARIAASQVLADERIIRTWQALPVPFSSFDEQLSALAEGRVDYILTNEGVSERFLSNATSQELKIAYDGDELALPLAMAVPHDNPMLASILSKTLASFDPDDLQLLEDKWFNVRIETGVNHEQLLSALLLMFGSIIVVGGVGYLWNRSLSREIRQRQHAEIQLSHQLQLMETLLDTLPNMVVLTNEHQEIVISNRAYRQFYFGGTGVYGDYKTQLKDSLPQELLLRIQREDSLVWNNGQDIDSQETAKQPDGQIRLITYHKRLFRSSDGEKAGVLTVLTDMTEQLQAKACAQEAERRLARLTDNIPGFVYQYEYRRDGQGRFHYVSAGIREMSGLSAEQILGSSAQEVLPLFDTIQGSEFREEMARQVREEQRLDLTISSHAQDGRLQVLQVRGNVTPQNDGSALIHGMVQDITTMHEQQEALQEARQKAEAATKARENFLATMSHELRTPIAGMHGMLELLQIGHLSEDQHYLVRNIISSANNLLYLVNDILDYSKMVAGQLHLESKEVNLAEVLCAVVRSNAARARQKGLQVNLVWDPALPDWAMFDPSRLGQICTNLLHNAIKFTEQGAITLTVTYQADRLQLTVEDTGIGISPVLLPRLFSPFEQGENSTCRRFGGSGLGLAISRNLAEQMGGTLTLDSELGQGTCAKLSLPLLLSRWAPKPLVGSRWQVSSSLSAAAALLRGFGAEVEECGRDARLEHGQLLLDDTDMVRLCQAGCQGGEPGSACQVRCGYRVLHISEQESLRTSLYRRGCLRLGCRPLYPDLLLESCLELLKPLTAQAAQVKSPVKQLRGRVLVAEDHPINRALLQRQLTLLGVESEIHENGRLALAAWQEKRYDMLLTDCHMPELDGYRLTAALRAQGVTAPIIGITADVSEAVELRGRASGMTRMLYKPYSLADIGRVLGQYLMAAANSTQTQLTGHSRGKRWLALFGEDAIARIQAAEYLRSNDTALASLNEALVIQDWAALISITHSIKGAARMVGEAELADLAEAVESCSKRQHIEPLAELVRQLRYGAAEVSSETSAWLKE